MKLQVLSDTHYHPHRQHPPFTAADILPDADVLVLAGDLGAPLREMARWVRSFSEARPDLTILLVPGNHEYYGMDWRELDGLFQDAFRAVGPRVVPLQRQDLVLNGVRFLGATLWSWVAPANRPYVERGMSDYHLIRAGNVPITVDDTNARFLGDSNWIFNTLTQHAGEPAVVITHHLPSIRCVARRWWDSPLNPGFASSLDTEILKAKPALWIHGHTHDPVDVRLGSTRIVCNPVGYPGENCRRAGWKTFAVEI